MSWHDTVNYIVFANPVSKGMISGLSAVARTTGLKATTNPSNVIQIISVDQLPSVWRQLGCNRNIIRFAGLSGAVAVILGAYGAHRKSYPDVKDPSIDLRSVMETANRYHFLHTIALCTVPLTHRPKLTATLMIWGTILFCGPCYYRALTGKKNSYSKLAPIGGTVLILAWLSMIL